MLKTPIRRRVRDAAAGLGLHFLHMSEGPFSHDAGQIIIFLFLLFSKTAIMHCFHPIFCWYIRLLLHGKIHFEVHHGACVHM